jgi:signal transduction histidine kinase
VRLNATLLDSHQSPEEEVLTLRADKTVWHARLASGGAKRMLGHLQPGSLLGIAGICLIRSSPIETAGVAPLSFTLLLRGPGDVQVLHAPSWWTLERVRHGLALTLAAVSLAFIWVVVLRRRVHGQTEIIRRQLARETIHEERARIARELHDTLQQELIGISLQLDVAAAQMAERPEAAERALELARGMVRHSQDEARQSIWDLRSRALETGGLICALKELLPPLAIGSRAQVDITARGEARALPRWFEINLLRIAQEAVTNARKHAAARRIGVELDYAGDTVRVRISDDGCGFNAGESVSIHAGHFGLLGMRERAEKIGARLEVHSCPGEGTIVCVTAPIPDPNQPTLNPVPSS